MSLCRIPFWDTAGLKIVVPAQAGTQCLSGSASVASKKILIADRNTLAQRSLCIPPQRVQRRHIQQFSRRAIGLAGVEHELAIEADDVHHGFGQLADGEVFTGADVQQ